MSASKVIVLAVVSFLAFDYKFNNGRYLDVLLNQAMQLGYRMNDEFSSILRRVVPSN